MQSLGAEEVAEAPQCTVRAPLTPLPHPSRRIIGLTVGLSVLLIVGIVIAIFFSKMSASRRYACAYCSYRYHCVFLEKRAEGESTETWG